ncbi:hypothetical protein L0337_06120 [candidate division KSB1 bacterium]|nr:hypothetical protein [candidate division KSB1 bacterium]
MRSQKLFSLLLLTFGCLQISCSEKKKAASTNFITHWTVRTSFKYDLCSFVGLLSNREIYKKYYGNLQTEWSSKLPKPVAAAVKKIDEIIGPSQPVGPRLCVLFSAVAAEDSIAAILAGMDDDMGVRSRLMASDFASEKNWQQWQSLKPLLRTVFEHLQKERFDVYWRNNFYPKITAKLPRLHQELQSFDVIGDLERFLGDWESVDDLEVFALWLLQPHAVRLSGQHYLTDANYPMHVTVKSAYHELLHPYCERMVDSVLAKAFETLKADAFLRQKLAQSEAALGYRNFMAYCREEVVLAADLWVAERRRVISQLMGANGNSSAAAVRQYFERHEGGVHVLAGVIYSYLEDGLKLDRMSYTIFMKELFASGRLQPGRIEMRYEDFMLEGKVASR